MCKCGVRQVYLSTLPSIAREFGHFQNEKSISEPKRNTSFQSGMRIAENSNFPTDLTRTNALDSATGFLVMSKGRSSILFGHRVDNYIPPAFRIVGVFFVLIVV